MRAFATALTDFLEKHKKQLLEESNSTKTSWSSIARKYGSYLNALRKESYSLNVE